MVVWNHIDLGVHYMVDARVNAPSAPPPPRREEQQQSRKEEEPQPSRREIEKNHILAACTGQKTSITASAQFTPEVDMVRGTFSRDVNKWGIKDTRTTNANEVFHRCDG
ncbi:unnamed protein product [Cylicostephanus goldi]|uniref:Uncharacterized protein n=1 Tax=Cylicostephanus goldi TaxID=71465 RepID=A0A3P6V3B6_CYLGO|nr:unnamed protein product [Cylicostephanus goldi]